MRRINYLLTALFLLHFMQLKAQCVATGSHYTANYPAGWNFTHISPATNAISYSCGDNNQGNIWSAGTGVWFFTARDGREMRISRDIPAVSDQSWTMDFTLHITAPVAAGSLENNSPAIVLASLTSEQAPIMTGCTTGSDFCTTCENTPSPYRLSEMDAMWVSLTADPPTACQEDQADKHWKIVATAMDGDNGLYSLISSAPIPIQSGVNATYYIRLQRTSATRAVLSIYSDPNYSAHIPGSPQCFTVSENVQNLDALNHEVHAEGYCYRVFNGVVDNLKIDNGISCQLQALAPSFSIPSTICIGQPITVDATASAGQPITTHSWALQECDADGNGLSPGAWSQDITGQPAESYTFPASNQWFTVTCGKFYKVWLKTQNSCSDPVITTKIIYITCPPQIQTSPDVTLCQGESTTLHVSYRSDAGCKVRWTIYPTDQSPLDGPATTSSITVTPTQTTHYQVTVTDNVTGCSTTSIVNVDVYPNDPSFNLTVNNSNPSYFTVNLVPNDLNGQLAPGFGYGLTIEELNASNTPYYAVTSMGNTTCWWNYPGAETFKGFVSTGTGTNTYLTGASGCGTNPGRFLYNHTYRITRMVLNDYCAPKQVSVKVTSTKSGEVIVYEDKDAPDMTAQLLAQHAPAPADRISIFPNPSDGIFTVELEEAADGSLIEVTNTLGEKVKTITVAGRHSELDMTGFAKGIYIVTISGNGNTVTKKIVLE